MPRWEPLSKEYVEALRLLARMELSYAESLRALIPVAVRTGEPRPSYWRVRRFLIIERRRIAERREIVDQVVADLLAGLVMRPLGVATQAVSS
jgi:hypothetical protein